MTVTFPIKSPAFPHQGRGPDFAIHFGVKIKNVEHIPTGLPWVADGDGWETWGEAMGTENNDADTAHVIIHHENLGLMLNYLAGLELIDFLVPMKVESQRGTIVSITSPVEWSNEYGSFTTLTA